MSRTLQLAGLLAAAVLVGCVQRAAFRDDSSDATSEARRLVPIAESEPRTMRWRLRSGDELRHVVAEEYRGVPSVDGASLRVRRTLLVESRWRVTRVSFSGVAEIVQEFDRVMIDDETPDGLWRLDVSRGSLAQDDGTESADTDEEESAVDPSLLEPEAEDVDPPDDEPPSDDEDAAPPVLEHSTDGSRPVERVARALVEESARFRLDPLGAIEVVESPPSLRFASLAAQTITLPRVFTEEGWLQGLEHFGALPVGLVAVGDEWSSTRERSYPFGEVEVRTAWRFEGEGLLDGRRVQRITTRKTLGASETSRGPLTVRFEDFSVRGELWFDDDDGAPIEYVQDETRTLVMTLGGHVSRQELTGKVRATLERLSAAGAASSSAQRPEEGS